jgi:hypothetical protein
VGVVESSLLWESLKKEKKEKKLLSGPPEDIFGIEGGKGALQTLLDDLAELNLFPNNSKASRRLIPSMIKQPKVFEMNEETG